MDNSHNHLQILAVDCCHHVIGKLRRVPRSDLFPVSPKDAGELSSRFDLDLIAIGVARYPVRRLFISQLRRIYPHVPILVLRRELVSPERSEEVVRGEFVLSDQSRDNTDCEMVVAIRKVMPFEACEHLQKNGDYEIISQVVNTVSESYADPSLSIGKVARKIKVSPKRLSTILNQQVGLSFRNLLRQIRLEQAKRMLRTRQYSVKEVALRVGFTDSHYFSRSFKELTGQNARDYQDMTMAI